MNMYCLQHPPSGSGADQDWTELDTNVKDILMMDTSCPTVRSPSVQVAAIITRGEAECDYFQLLHEAKHASILNILYMSLDVNVCIRNFRI